MLGSSCPHDSHTFFTLQIEKNMLVAEKSRKQEAAVRADVGRVAACTMAVRSNEHDGREQADGEADEQLLIDMSAVCIPGKR